MWDMLKSLLGLDSWTFYVAYDRSPLSGADMEKLLNDHGIKISNRNPPIPPFTNNDLFFNVKLEQAEFAEDLLIKAGVPLKYGLYSIRNRRRYPEFAEWCSAWNNTDDPGPMPVVGGGSGKKQGSTDWLNGLFNKVESWL